MSEKVTQKVRPTATGGRPTLKEAEQIEDKIVQAARALFFAHGYGATSIETIARTAGISKRTFYHRFENKPAIFKAVVNDLIHRHSPGDIGDFFQGDSCEVILQRLAQALLKASLSTDTLALYRLMIAEATRFPELGLVMNGQGTRQQAIEEIARLLASETKAGRLNVANPAMAAEMFMQLIVGLPQRKALGLGKPMTSAELTAWAHDAVKFFLHGCNEG